MPFLIQPFPITLWDWDQHPECTGLCNVSRWGWKRQTTLQALWVTSTQPSLHGLSAYRSIRKLRFLFWRHTPLVCPGPCSVLNRFYFIYLFHPERSFNLPFTQSTHDWGHFVLPALSSGWAHVCSNQVTRMQFVNLIPLFFSGVVYLSH